MSKTQSVPMRKRAGTSVRQMAAQAHVSNSMLGSKIPGSKSTEPHRQLGVRTSRAAMVRHIASAFKMTTPVMYMRAGLNNPKGHSDAPKAIASDRKLTAKQRQTLTEIYDSFVCENQRSGS